MLLYQVRERSLDCLGQEPRALTFPGAVVIRARFGPPESFGEGDDPTGFIIRGHDAKGEASLFTGRMRWRCSPPLHPLAVSFVDEKIKMEVRGAQLTVCTSCDDKNQFGHLIASCMYVLPMLLSLGTFDPPVVVSLDGSVNEIPFGFTLLRAGGMLPLTDQDWQEKQIRKAWEQLSFVPKVENRRLLAALQYFYTARRLTYVGFTAFEFMAEALLNYAKVLDVLFTTSAQESRQQIRQGLAQLGFPADEIERDFIPVLLLRNEFDVAHVALTVPNQMELDTLHRYTDAAELIFSALMNRVLDAVSSGSYGLLPGPDREELDPAKAAILQRLRAARGL